MKIIIAGGTGFLGSLIADEFKGEELVVLSRNSNDGENYRTVEWDGKSEGNWSNELEGASVLINLSGKSIDCRFTEKNKELIMNSRVDSTRILGKVMQKCSNPPKIWINASGAAIYKYNPDKPSDENSEIGENSFFQNVCRSWEEAFYESNLPAVRKVAIRIPVVLSTSEGALVPLLKLAKFGLGGKQGSGNQKFSWIHQDDFKKVIRFIVENDSISGAVNMASPNPVSNKELMKTLRKSLGVPIGIRSPSWLVRLGGKIIGVEADLVLDDLFVVSEVLNKSGYEFQHQNLSEAIDNLLK